MIVRVNVVLSTGTVVVDSDWRSTERSYSTYLWNDSWVQTFHSFILFMLHVILYGLSAIYKFVRIELSAHRQNQYSPLLIKGGLNIEHFVCSYNYKDLDAFSQSWARNDLSAVII